MVYTDSLLVSYKSEQAANEAASRAEQHGFNFVKIDKNMLYTDPDRDDDFILNLTKDLMDEESFTDWMPNAWHIEFKDIEFKDPDFMENAIKSILTEYPLLKIERSKTRGHMTVYPSSYILSDYELKQVFGKYGEIDIYEERYIKRKLLSPYASIYPSGLLSDFEFNVSGTLYKAHKAIVASSSDYFLILLTKYRPNDQMIYIDDVNPLLFKDLLDLIYYVPVKLDGLYALELVKLINFFGIKNSNIKKIIESVRVRNNNDFKQYITLLSEIYPEGFSTDILNIISRNISKDTDLSFLSDELRTYLQNY